MFLFTSETSLPLLRVWRNNTKPNSTAQRLQHITCSPFIFVLILTIYTELFRNFCHIIGQASSVKPKSETKAYQPKSMPLQHKKEQHFEHTNKYLYNTTKTSSTSISDHTHGSSAGKFTPFFNFRKSWPSYTSRRNSLER